MKVINFYKDNNLWFADLPEYLEQGGTLNDLQMVMGADEWLDVLSNNTNNVTLLISTENDYTENLNTLCYIGDTNGDIPEGTYQITNTNKTLWLCNVTLWFFNTTEYPLIIYYKIK